MCKIFRGYRNLLNLIHFNTKEPEKLFDDMCLAQDLAGPNCHGFQLNIAWPDKRVLERYKKYALFHHKTIVLQCGGNALREVGSPFNLGLRLRDYEGLVDYVLVDPSGGLGKEFDPGLPKQPSTTSSRTPSIPVRLAWVLPADCMLATSTACGS